MVKRISWLSCVSGTQILQHIIPALAEDSRKSGTQYVLALTGDHSTPVEVRTPLVPQASFASSLCTVRRSQLRAGALCTH